MKKILFTLVMIAALAMVAGTAKAQGKFAPYPSGNYTYSVPYTLVNAGEVTLNLTGGDMTLGTTTPAGLTSGGTVALASGSGNIVIPITFGSTATGNKSIEIIVQDLTSTCSNNIHLDITMATPPSIDVTLSRSGDAEICQTVITSSSSDTPGSDGQTNTITFTVNASITAPVGSTWDYTISIPNPTPNLVDYEVRRAGVLVVFPLTRSNLPITTTSEEYVVTFTTTTGVANATILGTVSAVSVEEPIDNLSFNETGAGSNTAQTVAKTVPTLGNFF